MPELPEVETVRLGLGPHLEGRRITQITLNRADLRVPFPQGLVQSLQGQVVRSIARRAKYLLFQMSNDAVLIAHLGMSGTMVLVPQAGYVPRTHDHVLIDFNHELRLVFNDPRRFGLIVLGEASGLAQHPLLAHLGPEPLGDDFNASYLKQALGRRQSSIKQAIMDQAVVVGVGNIYASEALFRAKIHPQIPALNVKNPLFALVEAIKQVLLEAIDSGGSTLRDYVRSTGDAGYFQHQFAVYGRDGAPCISCKSPIQRLVQGGRATYFCNNCQKVM